MVTSMNTFERVLPVHCSNQALRAVPHLPIDFKNDPEPRCIRLPKYVPVGITPKVCEYESNSYVDDVLSASFLFVVLSREVCVWPLCCRGALALDYRGSGNGFSGPSMAWHRLMSWTPGIRISFPKGHPKQGYFWGNRR